MQTDDAPPPEFSPAIPYVWIYTLSAFWLLLHTGPSVALRDGGELSTAVFLVDVPHPTGFPVDVLLARLLQLLPFGDAAFRANAYTSLWMAAACTATSLLVDQCTTTQPRWLRAISSLLSPVVLLSSASVLRAGTAMEVYASSLAVGLGSVVLLTLPASHRSLRLAALAFGLSFGLHISARPPAFLALLLLGWELRSSLRRHLATLLLFFLVGASSIAYLPVAARREGPINWGNPRTFTALRRHLSAARIREAYQSRMFVPWRMAEDTERSLGVVREDVGLLVLLLGAFGMVFLARKRGFAALFLVGLGDFVYATVVNPMGLIDRQVLFLFEATLAVSSVASSSVLFQHISSEKRVYGTALTLFVLLLTRPYSLARSYAASSDGWIGSELRGGAGALGAVPPRSIVLCSSDDQCGLAMYAQWVEGERPDVTVLPRQHLWDSVTWKRLRVSTLGAEIPQTPASVRTNTETLRRWRLQMLVQTFPDRIRWETGDLEDERIIARPLRSAETPVLCAIVNAPVAERDPRPWLQSFREQGVWARGQIGWALSSTAYRVLANDAQLAQRLYRDAIANAPNLATPHTNLAVLRAREGAWEEAISLSEHAAELDPNALRPRANLARYLQQVGSFERAQEVLEDYRRRGGRE